MYLKNLVTAYLMGHLIICFSLAHHYITRRCNLTSKYHRWLCVSACVCECMCERERAGDSGPLLVSDEWENRTLDYPRHSSNGPPAIEGYWAPTHKWSNIEGRSHDLDSMSFRTNDALIKYNVNVMNMFLFDRLNRSHSCCLTSKWIIIDGSKGLQITSALFVVPVVSCNPHPAYPAGRSAATLDKPVQRGPKPQDRYFFYEVMNKDDSAPQLSPDQYNPCRIPPTLASASLLPSLTWKRWVQHILDIFKGTEPRVCRLDACKHGFCSLPRNAPPLEAESTNRTPSKSTPRHTHTHTRRRKQLTPPLK